MLNHRSFTNVGGRFIAPLLAFSFLFSSVVPTVAQDSQTTTPIKHVVVIFQENISFDHYFATYPNAKNLAGEQKFFARPGTPSVNGLSSYLLTHNPNASNPFRISPAQAGQCDQDHNYRDEQRAFDTGLMDKFVEFTGNPGPTDGKLSCNANQVMGYVDGNSVTALWNYAQYFAMSDNSYGTTFGPSTPGALNLVSGQTHGYVPGPKDLTGEVESGSVMGDPQPLYDNCSTRDTVGMTGINVGNLLNNKNVSWGFFQGGFADCKASHIGSNGNPKGDYIPHHEPFQYYPSTANPTHARPASVSEIGHDGSANHQYDMIDFWAALKAGNLPAVTFLKAPGYQDGHASYSDPLAEQQFIVSVINALQNSPEWRNTAVIMSWDDSDGWYDHVMPPIVTQSSTASDALTGVGACGSSTNPEDQGRCGYGPRLPLLVVSPYAKRNFVDHSITDQSSILRFIEDNWNLGRIGGGSYDAKAGSLNNMFDFHRRAFRRVLLDPKTGEPTRIEGDDN